MAIVAAVLVISRLCGVGREAGGGGDNQAAVDRLGLSERVLAGWEGMVATGATPIENRRLIENEIAILQKMTDDPERRAGPTIFGGGGCSATGH